MKSRKLTSDELKKLNDALALIGDVQCPLAIYDTMNWRALHHVRVLLNEYIYHWRPKTKWDS